MVHSDSACLFSFYCLSNLDVIYFGSRKCKNMKRIDRFRQNLAKRDSFFMEKLLIILGYEKEE